MYERRWSLTDFPCITFSIENFFSGLNVYYFLIIRAVMPLNNCKYNCTYFGYRNFCRCVPCRHCLNQLIYLRSRMWPSFSTEIRWSMLQDPLQNSRLGDGGRGSKEFLGVWNFETPDGLSLSGVSVFEMPDPKVRVFGVWVFETADGLSFSGFWGLSLFVTSCNSNLYGCCPA